MSKPTGAAMTVDFVYVALLDCGCCIGAAGDLDPSVLEWLNAGLAVKRVTAAEWRRDYLPGFLMCSHGEATVEKPGGDREDPVPLQGHGEGDAQPTPKATT